MPFVCQSTVIAYLDFEIAGRSSVSEYPTCSHFYKKSAVERELATPREDVNMGVLEERWCSATSARRFAVQGPTGRNPHRHETTTPLREVGLFNFPLLASFPPTSADLHARRRYLSDVILSQLGSIKLRANQPVTKALASLDKLESQYVEAE